MSHSGYLLRHSSPSHHTVEPRPDFLEGRVLHLAPSAVAVPKLPSAGEGRLHAEQKTATVNEKGRCGRMSIIHTSQQGGLSNYLCQCHGAKMGEKITRFFSVPKSKAVKELWIRYTNRQESWGEPSYQIGACRRRAASLEECACTAGGKMGLRTPVCCSSLRCPQRARAAGYLLRLFHCGLPGI